MARKERSPGAADKAPRVRKPRSLAGRAQAESDPEWRRWFLEIEHRRKAQQKKATTFIVAKYQKDGVGQTIARRKTPPTQLKTILKKECSTPFGDLNTSLMALRQVWMQVVPKEIATESDIVSFKNGVVTIGVRSGALLQEIRQFHSVAITQDLRDAWPLQTPLLKLAFRMSKS